MNVAIGRMLKMHDLAASRMSETSAIAESSYRMLRSVFFEQERRG
jgi:hypothetical protein